MFKIVSKKVNDVRSFGTVQWTYENYRSLFVERLKKKKKNIFLAQPVSQCVLCKEVCKSQDLKTVFQN